MSSTHDPSAPSLLDANGDLSPPWARFPHYEHGCIGWRMGYGEHYLSLFRRFIASLDADRSVRLDYLRRHPKAPFSWASLVASILEPHVDFDESPVPIHALVDLELLASDVAYSTWLATPSLHQLPWNCGKTPLLAARYNTRELWFAGRRYASLRASSQAESPQLPAPWRVCAGALQGEIPTALSRRKGLLTLAQGLCASSVVPPWKLGATVNQFKDRFSLEMGYVDAFRLWLISAVEDHAFLDRFLTQHNAPSEWAAWCRERACLEFDTSELNVRNP